ncbi:MAG: hypothetical protein ACIARR_01695 [Phycisphaerales bacterium JB059]
MNQLRQAVATIQTYLGRMTASQKLLVGSLAVIALMTFFVVSRYAARPTLVDLMQDDPNLRMVDSLQAAGIHATTENGRLMVPETQRLSALAMLGQRGQLPSDTVTLFENLAERQDWKNSRQQNRTQYNLALQNELARIISRFHGVKSASVIIDIPDRGGLGRTARAPTASATVFTSSGGALDQGTVDAVANLVAGASAGLEVSTVRVIDGSTGRQRKPSGEDDFLATSYIEHTARAEVMTQRKLAELLSHVPGVVVAVTAQVDVTRVSTRTNRYLNKGEGTISLPRSETSLSETESFRSQGGEPGVRSNTSADISTGAGGGGTSFEKTNESIDNDNFPGVEEKQVVDPRGSPTFLAASVNIPQGYIEELVRRSKGDENAEVTEQEVQEKFATIRPEIEASLKPHVTARAPDGSPIDGEVQVSMIPVALLDVAPAAAQAGFLSTLTSGGAGGGGGGLGGIVNTAVVALLAVVALGMMVMMVRKSSRPIELPTPEELVGIPPALQADSDLVGEADESDAPMPGIELGDDEIKRAKLLEQVAEMVKQNPETAASLLSRWIEAAH